MTLEWHEVPLSPCEHCGAEYQHVRPGKTQPTCDCCPQCGTAGYRYYGEAESPITRVSGWLCLKCDVPGLTP